MRFSFDLISFLIGFAVASVIALILNRFRGRIARVRQTAESQAGATRRFITNTSEGRYYGDLVKMAQSYHIAGNSVKLTEICVEPRFISALEPIDPTTEQKSTVFHVVPKVHEFPYIYAPYNIETLSISELRNGELHLALLGIPGSGKSTTLAMLALVAADEIELPTIDMTTDEIFEDEIKDLPPAEKEKAIEQRKLIQERAIEHLQQAQKKEEEEGTATHKTIDFHRLLPILVHMRDIDLRPETYGAQANGTAKAGKPLDPAEPIVKALQHRAGGVTASTLPRMIYNRLNAGTCMVLIDGFDEIPLEDRPEKLAWLRQFVSIYSGNFIVVAGPATGYDPLVNIGLTPIFLRAWTDADFEALTHHWAQAWPRMAARGRKLAPIPEERLVRRVATQNRGRTPLDVTLQAWAAFAGDEQEVGRRGWYDFYIRRYIDSAPARNAAEKVAAAVLDAGGAPLSRDKIKEVVTAALAGPDGKSAGSADEIVTKLTARDGLMIDWAGSGGAYGFKHLLLTGMLAGDSLATAAPEKFAAIATNPAWDVAMPFAAARVDVETVAMQRLNAPPDLLYTNLFSLVSWLADSPANAAWRAEVFKRLTAALLAPNQYPAIRERAVSSLVSSRDKNIIFILRQALKAPDAHVRRLGCIGMGALGDGESIKDLGPMLTDSDPNVQLAAGLALGAIGTEAALETMLAGLLDGEQGLRQAVSEALAAIPGEGHAVLRDAMDSKDMQVRRAAVFGLARIKSAWAISLLYRALIEDEQWYVRNAAEQAFQRAERPEEVGVTRHPEADALVWLVAWAAQRGEGVPAGPNARQVLIRVLQEGDPAVKAAAALTLANLGHVPALKPLYGALRDRDEKVRAAVYEALGELQERLGQPLPAVM
jgi:HEAT repeat protein